MDAVLIITIRPNWVHDNIVTEPDRVWILPGHSANKNEANLWNGRETVVILNPRSMASCTDQVAMGL